MDHQLSKEELRTLKTKRSDFANIPRNGIHIVLDNFKVHHNVGTILRLADAVLAKKVYLCGSTETPPNIKVRKSARGSEKWVDWQHYDNAEAVVKSLKSKGVEIVSLEITDESIPYTKYNLPEDKEVCLILGREYDGVSQELLDLSDYSVHLPIAGMCNSINVSNAASVMLYHLFEQFNSRK